MPKKETERLLKEAETILERVIVTADEEGMSPFEITERVENLFNAILECIP